MLLEIQVEEKVFWVFEFPSFRLRSHLWLWIQLPCTYTIVKFSGLPMCWFMDDSTDSTKNSWKHTQNYVENVRQLLAMVPWVRMCFTTPPQFRAFVYFIFIWNNIKNNQKRFERDTRNLFILELVCKKNN